MFMGMKATTLENLPTKPLLPRKATSPEQGETASDVVLKEEKKLKHPSLYKVLIHNDDYTTMDFVVVILRKYFNKSKTEADQITLSIHHDGVGVCGIYTYEVAETKCQKVIFSSRQKGHPLKCTIEKE